MSIEDFREIRKDIKTVLQQQSNLIGRFDSHIDNKPIHQNPPCDAHKALSAKLWAVGTGVVTALIGSLYSVLKTH